MPGHQCPPRADRKGQGIVAITINNERPYHKRPVRNLAAAVDFLCSITFPKCARAIARIIPVRCSTFQNREKVSCMLSGMTDFGPKK